MLTNVEELRLQIGLDLSITSKMFILALLFLTKYLQLDITRSHDQLLYTSPQSANPGHEIERQPGQFDPLPIVSSVNSKYRFSVLHLSLRYLTMKHKLLQGNRSLAVLCGCGNENFLLKGSAKYFSTRKCTKKWGRV